MALPSMACWGWEAFAQWNFLRPCAHGSALPSMQVGVDKEQSQGLRKERNALLYQVREVVHATSVF